MKDLNKSLNLRLVIKKCYICGTIAEQYKEPEKCADCGKSFLPLNYFQKVHNHEKLEFKSLFADSDELHEEDLVRGIYVIW